MGGAPSWTLWGRPPFFYLRKSANRWKLGSAMKIISWAVLIVSLVAAASFHLLSSTSRSLHLNIPGSASEPPGRTFKGNQTSDTATARTELPSGLDVLHSAHGSIQSELLRISRLEDWSLVNDQWLPTPSGCVYWMKHRIEQIQRIVGNDQAKAILRGWKREWPPYEGFPTESDYDRVSNNKLAAFSSVLEFKTYQSYVEEALSNPTLGVSEKESLGALNKAYAQWIEDAWERVGSGDAYPGWNDLMQMGHRMQIE